MAVLSATVLKIFCEHCQGSTWNTQNCATFSGFYEDFLLQNLGFSNTFLVFEHLLQWRIGEIGQFCDYLL